MYSFNVLLQILNLERKKVLFDLNGVSLTKKNIICLQMVLQFMFSKDISKRKCIDYIVERTRYRTLWDTTLQG